MRKDNRCLNFFKGGGILLIVVLHCEFPTYIGSALNMLARAGVPLFFMVSGYFLYTENIKYVLKKLPKKIFRTSGLCILYLAINILYYLISSIIFRDNTFLYEIKNSFSCDNLRDLIIFNRTIIGIGGWFLFALLYCYLIMLLLIYFMPWIVRLWLPILLLCIGFALSYGFSFMGITLPCWYYRNCYFDGLPFFLFGYLIRQNENQIKSKIKDFNMHHLSAFVLLGVTMSAIERFLLGGYDVYLGTIIIVLSLFIFSIFHPAFSPVPMLEKIGKSETLYIFLIHPFAIYFLQYIGENLRINSNIFFLWVQPVAVILITVIVSFLISSVVKKANSK